VDTTTLPRQLATDLWAELITAGRSADIAYEIVGLLPDRGQYELLEALNTGGLDLLLAQWIGDLAETLRCPAADAAHIRDLLTIGAAR
jgi:hypothetical protein